ncbi:hypothetical protein RYX36_007837 [Vicia faba]
MWFFMVVYGLNQKGKGMMLKRELRREDDGGFGGFWAASPPEGEFQRGCGDFRPLIMIYVVTRNIVFSVVLYKSVEELAIETPWERFSRERDNRLVAEKVDGVGQWINNWETQLVVEEILNSPKQHACVWMSRQQEISVAKQKWLTLIEWIGMWKSVKFSV